MTRRVRRSLEERLTTKVDTIDPRSTVTLTDRITAGPAFLDSLTPLVGVLLRGHEPGGRARRRRRRPSPPPPPPQPRPR